MQASGAVTSVLLGTADIASLPVSARPELGVGVSDRALWRSGPEVAGVMSIEAGGNLNTHVHRASHHHMWVLAGTCRVLGRDLGPGSYVHIPSGVDHGIEAPDGRCDFLYLYLRDPS